MNPAIDRAGAVNGTVAPPPAPDDAPASGRHWHRSSDVDWALVRAFRQQVADRLAKEVERREGIGGAAHRDDG